MTPAINAFVGQQSDIIMRETGATLEVALAQARDLADRYFSHDYGPTIGVGPLARPTFPHPDSPAGRRLANRDRGND